MLRKGTYVLAVVLLVAMVGCFPTDPRTSNQGGGSLLLTIGPKLLEENVGDLNPDEWQILADNAPALADQFQVDLSALGLEELRELPALTDDQAQSIVDFLDEQSVQTFSDLGTLAQQIDAGEVEVPEDLMELGLAVFASQQT